MDVTRAWRPDGDKGEWASVAVKPLKPLAKPVTLAAIKAEPRLADLEVLRQSRLSVTPIRDTEWRVLMEMGGAKP
jgi:predicted RNA-binding protein with PUA-like domain